MEAVKTHMGKNYAFDATAQGKGLWKEVTKSGKLGRIASKDLQQRWGNPNESGPLFQAPKTNVEKISDSIKETAPQTGRLKSFRSLLKDPNETVKSASLKSITQNFRPEMIVKQLFGKTAGMIAGKSLGVSSERLDAVARGFDGSNEDMSYRRGERRSRRDSPRPGDSISPRNLSSSPVSSSSDGELKSYLKTMTDELKKIREKLYGENTLAVKFSKSSDSHAQLTNISTYVNEKRKQEDISANFKPLPVGSVPGMPPPTAVPTGATAPTGAPTDGGGGPGILEGILNSIFSGLLGGGAATGGIGGLGKKLLSVIGKAFLGIAKKLPIIGPIIIAAMGLKDAYDEYMSGGDFSDAVGAFFESVADSLTFGLASSLAGEGGIKKVVSGLVDSGLDFFEDMVNSIGDFLKDKFIDPIVNLPTTLLNGIKGVVGDIFASIGNLSFEIPKFTLVPATPFTSAVTVGPYKISPFSMFSDVGKNLQQAAAEGKAKAEEIEAQKQEQRAARDNEIQERRAARDASKAEKAAGGATQTDGSDAGGKPFIDSNEISKEAVKNLEGAQDQTKSFEIEDTSLAGGVDGSAPPIAPRPAQTATRTTQSDSFEFSEQELSKNDPELYKEFVARKEELEQKYLDQAKMRRGFTMTDSVQRAAKHKASVDAMIEFRERAEAAAAGNAGLRAGGLDSASRPVTAVPFTPTPQNTDLNDIRPTGQPITTVPMRSVSPDANLETMLPTQTAVPQPRATGQVIQQSAEQLAATQNNAQTPAQPIIVNNTTNNSSGGGGGSQSQPTASLRNDEPTILRVQMENAIMAY